MADKNDAKDKKIGKAAAKVAAEEKVVNAWNVGFNKTNNPDGLIHPAYNLFHHLQQKDHAPHH